MSVRATAPGSDARMNAARVSLGWTRHPQVCERVTALGRGQQVTYTATRRRHTDKCPASAVPPT